MYLTNKASDIAGYKKIEYTPQETPFQRDLVLSNRTILVDTFIYDKPINTTYIDSGNHIFSIRAKISSIGGGTRFRIVPFLRHTNDTETTLFSFDCDEINYTTFQDVAKQIPQGTFYCNLTDRYGFRLYLITDSISNNTVSILGGGEYPSFIVTPARLRHNQLRDPNGDPNVQHLTAAQIADIPFKALPFDNVPVLFENWTNDSPYGTYPYQQIIPLQGVTENDFPDVAFSVSDIESGNYCPLAMTNNGNVIIYSKTNNTTTIPTILIHRL